MSDEEVYRAKTIELVGETNADKLLELTDSWLNLYQGLTSQLVELTTIDQPILDQVNITGFLSLCASDESIGYVDGTGVGYFYSGHGNDLTELILDDDAGIIALDCCGQQLAYINQDRDLYVGQLKLGRELNLVFSSVKQVALGLNHLAFVTNVGKLYVQGQNDYGQLGVKEISVLEPTEISDDVAQVGCGSYHTIYLTVQRGVYASGRNDKGQLGIGSQDDSQEFVLVAEDGHKISVAYDVTAIIDSVGTLKVCGNNSHGQLTYSPIEYPNILEFTLSFEQVHDIKFGPTVSGLITLDNQLYFFGHYEGQDIIDQVPILDNVIEVAIAGNNLTLVSGCPTKLKDQILAKFIPLDPNQVAEAVDIFIQNGQINMDLEALKQLKKSFSSDHETLAEVIANVIQEKVTFPYKAYTMSQDDVIAMFNNLLVYDQKFIIERYKLKEKTDRHILPWNYPLPTPENKRYIKRQQVVLELDSSDYERIDKLVDYFTEEQRAKARRNDQEWSPWEAWQSLEFLTTIVQELLAKNLAINTHELREALFRHVKEAAQFKATIALSFYEQLGCNRILDISAGWGDRLVAAIAKNVEKYLAYDPNVELKVGHDQIIDLFGDGDKNRYEIRYEPFESAKLPKGFTCDLIFTSPPYFDLEIYTQEKGQSINSYPAFEDWLIRFLFRSLFNAWSRLEVGGHMALHIKDIKGHYIVEPMSYFILSFLENAHYVGVIPAHGQKHVTHYRPVWIFRREKKPSADRTQALKNFQRNYGSIYRTVANQKW